MAVQVVPMPFFDGSSMPMRYTRADALWMASRIIAAASSCERVPASTALSRSPRARTCSRTVSAAVRDAMSPAACPPIPSQTR